MKIHWYYLHINGDLIHKRFCPEYSDFVQRVWRLDLTDRATAWCLILEAYALGAKTERIKELSEKWKCDLKDLVEFMTRYTTASNLLQIGLRKFLENIQGVQYAKWFNWLESTPKGEEHNWDTMPK